MGRPRKGIGSAGGGARGGKRRSTRSPAAGEVERIVSIPDDVTLSPQAQPPPGGHGHDRSALREKVEELSWSRFDQLVRGLARQIKRGFKPDAVVGVAHGGVFVGGALASALGVEFFPVRISRRSRDRSPETSPQFATRMPAKLKRKRVLVVDDVSSSGDTFELARALLERVGARESRTASLVTRAGGYEPDWTALTTSAFIFFPWDYSPVTDRLT